MTGDEAEVDDDPWTVTEEEEDDGGLDMDGFVLQESSGYMAPSLTFLSIFHTLIAALCVLGYYYLKVNTLHINPANVILMALFTSSVTEGFTQAHRNASKPV